MTETNTLDYREFIANHGIRLDGITINNDGSVSVEANNDIEVVAESNHPTVGTSKNYTITHSDGAVTKLVGDNAIGARKIKSLETEYQDGTKVIADPDYDIADGIANENLRYTITTDRFDVEMPTGQIHTLGKVENGAIADSSYLMTINEKGVLNVRSAHSDITITLSPGLYATGIEGSVVIRMNGSNLEGIEKLGESKLNGTFITDGTTSLEGVTFTGNVQSNNITQEVAAACVNALISQSNPQQLSAHAANFEEEGTPCPPFIQQKIDALKTR